MEKGVIRTIRTNKVTTVGWRRSQTGHTNAIWDPQGAPESPPTFERRITFVQCFAV